MINYEAVIIEADQQLTRLGQEPLYAIYPVDGLAIADSPMGFVTQGDPEKEKTFQDLQAYLLSDAVQQELLHMGRRTGVVGMNVANADKSVFNPDWGIDATRAIVPITFPSAAVIREALVLYQTAFRKPSFTIYCLDFSGSMEGEGAQQLEEAMHTLLDQESASQYLLQGNPDDITVVLIFNHTVINVNDVQAWTVRGNDPQELLGLYDKIASQQPNGGTNIYLPVQTALDIFFQTGVGNRFPAVILMTDGQSNAGSLSDLSTAYNKAEYQVPVFAITFGNASTDQLKQITDLTSGRIFDGTVDLVNAFRQAKGYN
jgi:Ca-activated chloride channel family protein